MGLRALVAQFSTLMLNVAGERGRYSHYRYRQARAPATWRFCRVMAVASGFRR